MEKPGRAEVNAAHARVVALYQATVAAMLAPSPEGSNDAAKLLEEGMEAARAYGRAAREADERDGLVLKTGIGKGRLV